MTIASRLFMIAGALAVGCGSAAPGGPPDDPAEMEDLPPLVAGELVIAVQPIDTVPWGAPWEGVFDDGFPSEAVRSEGTLTLALGDGYPSTVSVTPDYFHYWFPCEGAFSIASASAVDPALRVQASGASGWRIEATAEGTFAATAQGTFTPEEPASCLDHLGNPAQVEFEIAMTVVVKRPAAVQLDLPTACEGSERPILASSGRFASEQLPVVLDADGNAFQPQNASRERPAMITVRAASHTLLGLTEPERGFYALTAVGSDDTVRVSAFDEELIAFELVDAAAIDDVDVAFVLMGGKVGGGIELESGQRYGEGGWPISPDPTPFSSITVLALAQYVAGDPVCTGARADAFTIASSTPAICKAYPDDGHGLSVPEIVGHQVQLHISAELLGSGTCTLDLRGPDLAAGNGWSAPFSAELLNVQDLFSSSGR